MSDDLLLAGRMPLVGRQLTATFPLLQRFLTYRERFVVASVIGTRPGEIDNRTLAPDLVIRGGTVVDGTGRPGYRADVAVAGGRVVDIAASLRGDVELDASGCVVSPGFIDIHTHYDAQVFWDPALTPSCFHGVTTVVAGNCGFSIAPTRPEHRTTIAATLERVEDMNAATLLAGIPWDFETFPEYLASVARRGVGLNFANYLGHTALRLYVMGDAASERPATAAEVDRMAGILREALRAGAAGFAVQLLGYASRRRRAAGAQPSRQPCGA